MGKQLLEMYDEAKKLGGLTAQIRLAIITKLPSTKAHEADDSPENMEIFLNAMIMIRKEFSEAKKVS